MLSNGFVILFRRDSSSRRLAGALPMPVRRSGRSCRQELGRGVRGRRSRVAGFYSAHARDKGGKSQTFEPGASMGRVPQYIHVSAADLGRLATTELPHTPYSTYATVGNCCSCSWDWL